MCRVKRRFQHPSPQLFFAAHSSLPLLFAALITPAHLHVSLCVSLSLSLSLHSAFRKKQFFKNTSSHLSFVWISISNRSNPYPKLPVGRRLAYASPSASLWMWRRFNKRFALLVLREEKQKVSSSSTRLSVFARAAR